MTIRNIISVVSGMDEEYPYQIIKGINKFAEQNSINVTYFAAFGGIIDSKQFDTGEYSIYNLPDYSKFDGAILLSNTFSNLDIRTSIINKVKSAAIPAVIFECQDHKEFNDISINNYTVMKKLVEHLITEHGARTFNYISGPPTNIESNERYRAFRDALAEHDIDFDEKNRFYSGLFRSYDGIKAIEAFTESGMTLPDAFVSANDSMALTAMDRLQQLGYRIPDDVIITGFDHTFNAQNSFPKLTTVKRPLYYSGKRACNLLLNLIDKRAEPKSVPLEADPIFTESCGCVEKETYDIRDFKKNTYKRIEGLYTNIHMLNRLIAGLAGAETLEECINCIEKMLGLINCDNFSLCLIKNWDNTYNTAPVEDGESEYPPEMTAPFILKDGKRTSVESFPSRQLHPIPLTTGGNISYFIPLHYKERYLGYYIITNNDYPITSLLCHTMTMCIGNAISNISKLNVLDPLCKIYNRSGFVRNAGFVFNECLQNHSPISICFIDMDGLKTINDLYGHKEGDFAIRSIADAISSSCDSMDVCGRFGGDEFVVLGRGDDFIETFRRDVVKKLKEINEQSGKPYPIAASIGYITEIPQRRDQLFELIQKADAKMYENKRAKKCQRK
ncbi:GGDEF domain-containing protein [Ruminococcus sp. HUN007]|uniref:substrate-binding and GGDEF domain-containing protein n=1 Tax=Ruminococcus sp. HUN007 TaxID=1514668 RepID=UPI0005D263AC|nr:GGDEF domain-containing protein [Ruminococcus sp. HUN007]